MVSGLSLGGLSVPPLVPSVRTQAVTTGKSSQTVSRANAGTEVSVVPAGTEGSVQASHDAGALPPVNPTGEAQTALMHKNGASPERSGETALPTTSLGKTPPAANGAAATAAKAHEGGQNAGADAMQQTPSESVAQAQQKAAQQQQRYPGELPPAYKSPDQRALEEQINNFVPNLWKASAAAVTSSVAKPAETPKSGAVTGYTAPQPGDASKQSSGSVLNMKV